MNVTKFERVYGNDEKAQYKVAVDKWDDEFVVDVVENNVDEIFCFTEQKPIRLKYSDYNPVAWESRKEWVKHGYSRIGSGEFAVVVEVS
jgi:hypothetical protein